METQAKKTPLHMAAQNGRIEVCANLLKMKADANATDVVSAPHNLKLKVGPEM